ncbi:MAG: hypothetical protein LBT89_02380 [Planctomycetaceae bacterium]|jgi:hypothetical protein|nr:hypothetical protein [Planctomycetaceae bacterium]
MTKPITIVTAVLQNQKPNDGKRPRPEQREELLRRIVHQYGKADIILLPAGFYQTHGHLTVKREEKEVGEMTKTIQGILNKEKSDAAVCFGFDSDKDQLAFAVNKTGLQAAARKFYHPKSRFALADDFNGEELGKKRTFEIRGKTFYLAVCFDVKALGKRIKGAEKKPNGVDAVLSLIHIFGKSINKEGVERGQGFSYFIRTIAGASLQWGVPVFASATFYKWNGAKFPSGILCKKAYYKNGCDSDLKNLKNDKVRLDKAVREGELVEAEPESAICKEYVLE